MAKNELIGVRLPPAAYEEIERQAALLGLTPAKWAEVVVLRAAMPVQEGDAHPPASMPGLHGHGGEEQLPVGEATAPDCTPVSAPPAKESSAGHGGPGEPVPEGVDSTSRHETPRAAQSWKPLVEQILKMPEEQARARMKELRAGRTLPEGFKDWDWPKRIEWMDANWVLSADGQIEVED